MDAEQYKEFEQKLKLADEYDHPVPNEKAWNAMSAKLDDAFNKEKKRRGIWFFILPLLALLVPAVFFLLGDNDEMSRHTVLIKKSNPANAVSFPNESLEKRAIDKNSTIPTEDLIKGNGYAAIDYTAPNTPLKKNKSSVNNSISQGNSAKHGNRLSVSPDAAINTENVRIKITDSLHANGTVSEAHNLNKQPTETKLTDTATNPTLTKANAPTEKEAGNSKQSKKKSFLSGLYISAAISPAKSIVSSGSGKWTTTYGGGIGYQIKKRWFIESGVYAGRSVYDAGPDDYNWEGTYGYKLKTVAADCFIIEIPVNLGYTFYEKRRLQLFAAAGISSQLMKRENYDYTATRYSVEYKGTWTYRNEHRHFISAARIALGAGYKLTNKLTLQAAPYYKKSLKGIGAGEVKLNTAGMNISVQYSPFLK